MAGVFINKLEKLLVLNYSMDETHPSLSHQTQAVTELAKRSKIIYVVTGTLGTYSIPPNVKVFSSNWVSGRPILSAFRFLRLAIPLLLRVRPTVVFSHMTDVQSSLLAPLALILRIPHYLWYAHAHQSVWLLLARPFLKGIITSTSGSCPVKGPKVFYIGQAVDPLKFPFQPKMKLASMNCIHVGRLDPSKKIEVLIESLIKFRIGHPSVTLTLVGDPSTDLSKKYLEKIQEKYLEQIALGWLKFKGAIPRSEVPNILSTYDMFVHAYSGSLDKSLIEATLIGIRVATINSEYLAQFGSWSQLRNPTLLEEIIASNLVSDEALAQELLLRRNLCEENHSISSWVNSLIQILS